MTLNRCAAAIAVVLSAASATVDASSTPTRIEVESRPTRVTAYRQGAWVERTITRELEPGHYLIVFSDLPVHWQSSSLQAAVTDPGRVIGIDTATRAVTTPPARIQALAAEVDEARQQLQAAENALNIRAASISYLRSMMERSADQDADRAGTADLQIEAIQEQLRFFADELTRQMAAERRESVARDRAAETLRAVESQLADAGSATTTARQALVELKISRASKVDLTLSYLVNQAAWSPRYDIRGNLAEAATQVEYRAEVSQQTGEDWTDVAMVLSTARPSRAANPPSLGPVYVDVLPPPPPPTARRSRRGGGGVISPDSAVVYGGMESESSIGAINASIDRNGSSVTYALPGRLSVPSNAQGTRRTLISQFEAPVDFAFVAVPVMTDEVYLRGRFKNATAFHLLPGPAGIFMGGNYIGRTQMESFPPDSEIELFFGSDPQLSARREMLTKNTGESGVFGGWVRTDYRFVLTLENAGDSPVRMEVWGRRPVSQSDQIEVSIENLSEPLSTVASYLETGKPRGLLCWNVMVPANRTGDDAYQITYDLEIERREGVQMTPLPE